MDFYSLLKPATDKLYRMAFALIPDDLQAEQLVIDSLNAYLIKDKKQILATAELENLAKKDIQLKRRNAFKGILKYMAEIGSRRATQLKDQLIRTRPVEFDEFYKLEPRVRLVIMLRYDLQFSVDEIEDMIGMPRYEVIEKVHNGRFLLLNNMNMNMNMSVTL